MSYLTDALRKAAKGETPEDIRNLEETAAWTIERLQDELAVRTDERDGLVRTLGRRDGLTEDQARAVHLRGAS